MSVPAAYLGVILIWATTPLAIQWSGDGPGFLFGVTGRMVIGATVALVVLRAMGLTLAWRRRARRTYLAAGLGIYGAMLATYWAAQHIPSGWISVVFGTAPIITGVMAAAWLGERSLTAPRVGGMVLGLAGLAVVFGGALEASATTAAGLLGVVVAATIHSASGVWVKRLDPGLPGLVVATGGLWVAVPLFLLTWFLAGATWPEVLPVRAGWAIVYLGVVGSVLGFTLYYYVLRRVAATRVALITLVTPVVALVLGATLNGEVITPQVWLGTALIGTGLVSFQFGERILARSPFPLGGERPAGGEAGTGR